MSGVSVDGQVIDAVYDAASKAVARARRGEGPTLIEARTYRFDEHEVGLIIPGAPYRSVEEVNRYKAHRDPIALFRKRLVETNVSDRELLSIETEATAAVDAAVRFGESSPLPEPESLYKYLYSTPLSLT
jgi:TPP-dependent pyruvate/acetoin dehydrogenase alpha subunit